MRNKSGFTIVEVLIVIAIMAVLMGIGFPFIMGWLPNFRLRNATRDVHSHLQLARMEAIKKHVNCTVSFVSFTGDAASGNKLAGGTINGYEIYLDADNDGQYDAGTDTWLKGVNVIHPTNASKSAYSNDVTIGANFTNNGLGEPSIIFRTNGLLSTSLGLPNGTVTLTRSDDASTSRTVVVNVAGRIRIPEQ